MQYFTLLLYFFICWLSTTHLFCSMLIILQGTKHSYNLCIRVFYSHKIQIVLWKVYCITKNGLALNSAYILLMRDHERVCL